MHERVLLDPLDGHGSAALVQQLEQGVPLAGVAGDPAVPAVAARSPRPAPRTRSGQLARGEDARQGRAQTLAQADEVVHRGLAAAVERRGPLGVFAGRAGSPVSIVRATRSARSWASRRSWRRPASSLRSRSSGRDPSPRAGPGHRGDPRSRGPGRRLGQAGGRVGWRKAEARVTHDGWSLAWPPGGRHASGRSGRGGEGRTAPGLR